MKHLKSNLDTYTVFRIDSTAYYSIQTTEHCEIQPHWLEAWDQEYMYIIKKEESIKRSYTLRWMNTESHTLGILLFATYLLVQHTCNTFGNENQISYFKCVTFHIHWMRNIGMHVCSLLRHIHLQPLHMHAHILVHIYTYRHLSYTVGCDIAAVFLISKSHDEALHIC